MQTIEQMAQEYCAALSNAPNGWGQNCHPVTGEISHSIMMRAARAYGNDETQAAIKAAMEGG